ncbi:MAG: two-component regulator propeller domain-containing protein [Ginsengibacter sp.]
MIRRSIACLYFLLLILYANAQFNENEFQAYTVLDGLSDNNVTCIAQDEPGYIWIGTEMGLNRFDGEEFKRYLSGKDPLYIPGTNIVNIIQCSNHRLGIVTRRGFQLINPQDFTYESYRFPDTSSFSIYSNRLMDGRELPDRSILLSSGTGIYSFDKPGHLNFRYDQFKPEDIGKKRIAFAQRVFSFDDENHVLIYYYDKGNKLMDYRYKNKKLEYIDSSDKRYSEFYPKRWGINSKEISPGEFISFSGYSDSLAYYNASLNKKVISKLSCLSQQELNYESNVFTISKNEFAITGSRSGYYLFHLDESTGIITSNGIKYLPSYKCNYLFVDNEKRLWVGTRTGLLKQKLNSSFIQSYNLFKIEQHSLSLRLSGVCRYKNKIYLGSFNRFTGLLVLDTATMQIEKQLTFYGGNNGWSEIGDVQCYHQDTLWISTTNGLLWLDINSYKYGSVLDNNRDTVLLNSEPFLYPPDKNGKAWMGDYMNGKAGYYDTSARTFTFFTADTKPTIPFTRIKHIVYDSYGDVWIGGHGLARWNNDLQQFDSLTTVYAGPNKYNDDILTITADKNGSLWLYNAENILLEYRIREKKFYDHDSREGLPEFVQAMANDVNDKLWFTTGNRLVCYNLSTKKIYYFDQADGLPAERASSRSIYFDKERNCFYSLHNNYLAVFPADIKEVADTKHLLITEIAFSDTIFYNPSNNLSLNYDQNNCSVQFTVLNYDAPNAYDFFYRIDKKKWINLEGSQVVFFNSLSSGKHHIEIKAAGKLGEEYTTGIIVSIASPFWATWWFTLLLLLTLAIFIYSLYRYRFNQLKKLFAMRTKISQDLHDEIGSTLGSISIYSEVAKKLSFKNEKADEAISKIGVVSRELIDKMSDIVWSINPNNESFEQLQNRMRAFAATMLTPGEIEFSFHAPANSNDTPFSMQKRRNIYLIFKEAINNIVKYANCTIVYIDLRVHENFFCMIIKDNGKGFDQYSNAVYNGNGIKNMQSRSNDMGAKLNIDSIINEGTTITITLKL